MPSVRIKRGNTLLLHGPASALLVEGQASVLGCPLSSRRRLIVRGWRSRPIYAEKNSVIDIAYGENGGYELIEGDAVPEEWRAFAEKISKRSPRVCVYGGADSGKTTLATLLVNALVKRNGLSVYLDLDLGQSNICPPTTIGYAAIRSPIPDVSYPRMELGEVAGYTSPTPLIEKHLLAVKKLAENLLKSYPEASISMDLDGWVSGEQAVKHKERMLEILKPNFLALIGDSPEEIKKTCEKLGILYEQLPPPRNIRRRDQSARKRLREIAYERFLRKSVVRKIPASWIEMKTITDRSGPNEVKEHAKALIQAYAENSGEIFDRDVAEALEELAKRRIGILSYLRDLTGRFVGISLLVGLDLRRNFVKILTPYQAQIKEIILGAILLSADGEEIYSDPKIFSLNRMG